MLLARPTMLTPDMKRIIEEQHLGFVATADLDGTPNVSPKGTFIVLDDETIAFGEIRSPGTIRNLRANPRIEVNFAALAALRAPRGSQGCRVRHRPAHLPRR
jgi:predicted pyridoxine 5'-phosphate oxidase superfamily flavin-nucleotide-binding protein